MLDTLGVVAAYVILVSSIITFSTRPIFDVGAGHWIGVPLLLMTFPLAYLLVKAPRAGRRPLYYIQVGLMLAWMVALFLLDYLLGVDFRDTRWAVILFVTTYFGGLGGMIGISFLAGRAWGVGAVILFFIAGLLAFVQRAVTGL